MALWPGDIGRIGDLQRAIYLLARIEVEQRLQEILAQHDQLADALQPVIEQLLEALEQGDFRRAQGLLADLDRELRAGFAVLRPIEERTILEITALVARAGAIAADLPAMLAAIPRARLPDLIDPQTIELRPPLQARAGIYFRIGDEVKEAIRQHVYQDGLNLSRRLHVRLEEKREELQRIVTEGIEQGRASIRLGEQIRQLDITSPQLPKYLDRLVQAVRSGDEKRQARALARAIEEAAQRKAGPLGIKDAVDRLIDAAQKGNLDRLEEAVQAFLDKKARYHAIVIARTEAARAFRDGFVARAREQPWVKGVRWVLSNSHPREDICDELATSNRFGLGPGVYPIDQVPQIQHPNCLCHVQSVVDADAVEPAPVS